jgi:hypothetical protein
MTSQRKDANGIKDASITIELSPAQVDQVIGVAGTSNGLRGALASVSDLTGSGARAALRAHRGLSSSLLSGLLVLVAFPQDRSYVGNAQIAARLGMSMATTHRYIRTLLAVGLLERDPETRKYRRA